MDRLNRNLYVMLKLTERPKTPGMTSKKTALPEGVSSFAGDFVLIWMKQRLIWLNLQRYGTRNGLSNIKESFTDNWQLKMSVLWLGKTNVKKKYLMCQIPIKMLKQHATPNSSLQNVKIYSSKGCRKTSQRWIYVASYLATYLTNTAVLNIRIFSRRYHFRL